MNNPIESLKNSALPNQKESESLKVESAHYELMNKLFSRLNDLKGFNVGMNGPREGKLFVNYEGVDFVMEVKPKEKYAAKINFNRNEEVGSTHE